MAEKINLLIENPALRQTMGRNGVRRVLERFDVRAITRRWEQTYESLLRDQTVLRGLMVGMSS